jgi:hypothetical protein
MVERIVQPVMSNPSGAPQAHESSSDTRQHKAGNVPSAEVHLHVNGGRMYRALR